MSGCRLLFWETPNRCRLRLALLARVISKGEPSRHLGSFVKPGIDVENATSELGSLSHHAEPEVQTSIRKGYDEADSIIPDDQANESIILKQRDVDVMGSRVADRIL